MNIERIEIKGLYGYIDKEIDFFNDLTLLVGINGSGKTSILNLLHWIIKPSLPNLCVTEFKSIKLTFTFKNIRYVINCKHNKSTLKYELITEKENYFPLTISIKVPPKDICNDEVLKMSLIQEYSSLRPEPKEKKTWDVVSKFPNPTIIGLDRNLYTEESERVYIDEAIRGKLAKKSVVSNQSPLLRVKEIINTEYRKKKNSILNLTNSLKNQLMLSAFDGSITIESFTTGIRQKLNLEQIEVAELRVNNYFLQFESKSFLKSDQLIITNYFSKLKDITKKYQDKPTDETVKLLFGLNANQFAKINKLLLEFEKFDENATKELVQINTFLDTINYFLKDSAKKLTFKEDTSEIVFNTLQKDGKVIGDFKDIKFLSSGEQQILILFSYIAFNSQDGRVFIIDEPELSLHIKWQEDFLSYLEKITPKSTQLILATHSPILVGKKKEKAKVLLPYNS